MKTLKSKRLVFVILAFFVVSCASNARLQPTMTYAPAAMPTRTPVPSPTPALTETPTSIPSPTMQTGCTNSALYLLDVTIPDYTKVKAGEPFTKTWRLRNTGKCTWNVRYTLVFTGGDKLGGQVTTPLGETPPGESLDISINLTAPSADGLYTATYELRDPDGKAMPVGLEMSVWVRIMVGNVNLPPVIPPSSQQPGTTPVASAPCKPQQNSGLAAQILALINGARADAKLGSLNLNAQLSAAAQGHSDDMACNNFLAHTGSNGSSIHQRVVAAGYTPSYSEEIIFASGTPQQAFAWWMNDATHRNAILNPKVMDVGIGYTYASGSAYGGYYTVDFAAP